MEEDPGNKIFSPVGPEVTSMWTGDSLMSHLTKGLDQLGFSCIQVLHIEGNKH